eukprot:jgi/Mesvir1/14262/Mv09696-RA.2
MGDDVLPSSQGLPSDDPQPPVFPYGEIPRVVYTAAGEVLDLTGLQLPNLSNMPIQPGITDLDLTQNRLRAVDPMLSIPTGLLKLSLRQNLLTDAEPLTNLPGLQGIRHLVLHDNHLKEIPPLEALQELAFLDISFNELASMAPIAGASVKLEELYLASNKIPRIEGLSHLRNLHSLELGNNGIREIQGLDELPLRQLWLGKNKITKLALPSSVGRYLRQISVQSNRLTSMQGIEGLGRLVNLRILDLGNNRILRLENLETLTRLEDLWVNDNPIELTEITADPFPLAACVETLSTIYMEGCPAAHDPSYKDTLLARLPALTQIDSSLVHRH